MICLDFNSKNMMKQNVHQAHSLNHSSVIEWGRIVKYGNSLQQYEMGTFNGRMWAKTKYNKSHIMCCNEMNGGGRGESSSAAFGFDPISE